MNNLWNYIQGLSLSRRNQAWLGERLLNASKQGRGAKVSKEIQSIPEEFRCDPYEISPSGDPFFADRRNVEELNRRIEEAHKDGAHGTVLKSREDIDRFLGLI